LSHTRILAKRDNTVPFSLSSVYETYVLGAELNGLGVKMPPTHFEQSRTGAGIAINLCGPVSRLISSATIYIFLVGLDLGFLCPLRAVAQNGDTPLALPHLETCQHVSHPLLPPKWRGVFLMAPFTASQLALSEIIYDGSLPAMLVKLYGVRSGDPVVRHRKPDLFAPPGWFRRPMRGVGRHGLEAALDLPRFGGQVSPPVQVGPRLSACPWF
jgi:hypothetical protein